MSFPAKTLSVLFTFLLAVGCSAEVDDDGGDTGDTTSDLSGAACNRQIIAKISGARRTALDRGLHWFDQKVSYSQTSSHEGYRTDCSGFVSMAWQLGTSYTTADFVAGQGQNTLIGSYDKLLPGDALVYRSGSHGHIVLFAGWQDAAKTQACVIEEESTALDMQFHVRTAASLRATGFKATRAKKLASAPAGNDNNNNPPPTPAGGDDPPPAGADECAADGDCNPGNDGSGKICKAGACVPGCHINAQCPGSTRCVSGQCR